MDEAALLSAIRSPGGIAKGLALDDGGLVAGILLQTRAKMPTHRQGARPWRCHQTSLQLLTAF